MDQGQRKQPNCTDEFDTIRIACRSKKLERVMSAPPWIFLCAPLSRYLSPRSNVASPHSVKRLGVSTRPVTFRKHYTGMRYRDGHASRRGSAYAEGHFERSECGEAKGPRARCGWDPPKRLIRRGTPKTTLRPPRKTSSC